MGGARLAPSSCGDVRPERPRPTSCPWASHGAHPDGQPKAGHRPTRWSVMGFTSELSAEALYLKMRLLICGYFIATF